MLLDLGPPADFAFGMRKLKRSYKGDAFRVRRIDDGQELDIGFNPDGDPNLSLLQDFLGSSNGGLTIWYDQTENGHDAIQTVAADMPLIGVGGTVTRFIGQKDKPIALWFDSDLKNLLVQNAPTSADLSASYIQYADQSHLLWLWSSPSRFSAVSQDGHTGDYHAGWGGSGTPYLDFIPLENHQRSTLYEASNAKVAALHFESQSQATWISTATTLGQYNSFNWRPNNAYISEWVQWQGALTPTQRIAARRDTHEYLKRAPQKAQVSVLMLAANDTGATGLTPIVATESNTAHIPQITDVLNVTGVNETTAANETALNVGLSTQTAVQVNATVGTTLADRLETATAPESGMPVVTTLLVALTAQTEQESNQAGSGAATQFLPAIIAAEADVAAQTGLTTITGPLSGNDTNAALVSGLAAYLGAAWAMETNVGSVITITLNPSYKAVLRLPIEHRVQTLTTERRVLHA